jgi:diacylglycerol kinase family enzyme
MNISDYDAIATVSGDGLVHEVINGLLTRPDWEECRKIPIGMVAAGTFITHSYCHRNWIWTCQST